MGVPHPGAQWVFEESWSSQPPRQSLLVAGVQVLTIYTTPIWAFKNRFITPVLARKNFHVIFFRFFETKTSGPLPNRFSLPLPRRLKRWLKAKIFRERERSRPALSSVSVQDLTKWSGSPFHHLPNLINLKAGYNEVSQPLRLCVPTLNILILIKVTECDRCDSDVMTKP